VKLQVQDLCVRYGERSAVQGVSLQCTPGRVTGIIGPNGSGKSSLVKAIAGMLPCSGTLHFDDAPARPAAIGYMPQDLQAPMALTVLEVVLLGRLGQLRLRVQPADLDAVRTVLQSLDIDALAGRYLSELSGGQRQMVFLAQALVAQPRLLLLDEPISALDVHHQLTVLERVRQLTRDQGLTTLLVLHDLQAAARYCDDLLLLRQGTVAARGTPSEVLTVAHMAGSFAVRSERLQCADGTPVLVHHAALAAGDTAA